MELRKVHFYAYLHQFGSYNLCVNALQTFVLQYTKQHFQFQNICLTHRAFFLANLEDIMGCGAEFSTKPPCNVPYKVCDIQD